MRKQSVKQQFEKFTQADHGNMQRRLVEIARRGAPRPKPSTLEGYALAQYTRQAVQEDDLVSLSLYSGIEVL
jgi:hypothetical protein